MARRRIYAAAVVALCWATAAPLALLRSELLRFSAPALAAERPPRRRKTLKYGTLPDQLGDVWAPEAPTGLVVLVHGGFWLPQYGKDLMTKLASDLMARNWAAWNVEYRRVDGPGWRNANSTLEDITAALRFLDSPEFPFKGLPVAVVGHSAGGHLALWSQLRPIRVTDCRAVVSVGGVLDLCDADEEALGGGAGAVARFLGYRDVSSLKRDVSPIDMLPPCLVNSLPPELARRGTVPEPRIGPIVWRGGTRCAPLQSKGHEKRQLS
ncbi:unnamed protein product [Durusdinium trenchii]|uniref:Uncharacterized protein n=2 Tax=Durusdinium trenchii TaxID=1381693 RepID=A0ABP0J0G8_9DINO